MNTNEFLKATESLAYRTDPRIKGECGVPRPLAVCKDGFVLSIQASSYHYCSPRINRAEQYASVEIGYVSQYEELLAPYADGPGVTKIIGYGYVPVEIADQLLEKHGGIDHWK